MTAIKNIYSKYIKPLTVWFGFHHIIKKVYWQLIISRNPISQINVAGTNVQFKISNKTEYARHQDLGGEELILADILSELNSDDSVYDIGANVGTYTCFLAKRLHSDQVVAVEPHPTNLESLRSNLELNNTDAIIVEKALSNRDGTAELSVESKEAGEGKHSLARGDQNHTINIELTTGERLMTKEKVPDPTVIKIDVEGAEYRVLEGLRGVFERKDCRLCYIEVHPDCLSKYGDSPADIEAYMKSYNYDMIEMENRGGEYFVKCMPQKQ